jgi:hypothetical protein
MLYSPTVYLGKERECRFTNIYVRIVLMNLKNGLVFPIRTNLRNVHPVEAERPKRGCRSLPQVQPEIIHLWEQPPRDVAGVAGLPERDN